ncbi:riboflavin biosynthesis protein PYRD, chloroplastic-like [Coffea arabica]|uniref:Riboflavin biosynthesis protein PYRD, chloroplastic n=1 Tax=Coffea arabica TaxID=13443 RepID=A0A6P6WIC0_COFAR|nr:riboflavin biosynthesis protein PYRD, chloroplastic-like [Coffea arabica]
MYVQTLPISKCAFHPINLSPCTHLLTHCTQTIQIRKVYFESKLKTGFCHSVKRVSGSQIGSGKGGVLVGVRCEGSHQGENDGLYIRRCVELARKAIGHTSPNPMVGCVIVKGGKIVGEGFHPKAGQPHAEVFALRDAGDLAENATAYVSLEPCNHYGRTPPCTEAFIKAKVEKVVVGMVDPNPIVASKGIDRLRDAGIEVIVGVEEELCKKLIEAWIHQMLTGKPFLTLRYSMSVDGHVRNQLGNTVLEPGGYYSKLLQEYDAIVFPSTLLSENSSFPASREPGANQPLQIVLAMDPDLPVEIPALTSKSTAKVIIFTEKETSLEQEATLKGVETVVCERINLVSVLEYCKRQGLCSVLLDLRGNIADFEQILREGVELGLFQKYVVEVLPIWVGSNEKSLNVPEKLRVKSLTSKVMGESVLLEGYFE